MAIASADRFDPHGLKKTRMQLASAGARIARRTTSWDSPGFVFSFALVAAACVVLYRLLDDVDVLKTAAALRAIPMRAIITAFLLIAASYFTLTFSGRRAEIDPVRHRLCDLVRHRGRRNRHGRHHRLRRLCPDMILEGTGVLSPYLVRLQ